MTQPIGTGLEGQWIGQVNGTLAGNLYAQIASEGSATAVRFRANMDNTIFDISGPLLWEDGTALAKLEGTSPDGSPLRLTVWFDKTEPTLVNGRWEAEGGHGGVFRMVAAPTAEVNPKSEPVSQIISREGKLPKITLIHPELSSLIEKLKSLIVTTNDVVVSAKINGSMVMALSEEFLRRRTLPNEINNLRLALAETKTFAPKTITIAFTDDQEPSYNVSSDDEAWVNGTWLSIQQYMKQYYTWFQPAFQRHGMSLNFVVFLVALTLAPNLATTPRFIFIAAVVVGMVVFKAIHDRISRVRIYPNIKTRTSHYDPVQIVSAIIAAAFLALGSWLFSFLQTSGLSKVAGWITSLLQQ